MCELKLSLSDRRILVTISASSQFSDEIRPQRAENVVQWYFDQLSLTWFRKAESANERYIKKFCVSAKYERALVTKT